MGVIAERITSIPAGVDWDSSPRFSPDGKRLVFTRFFATSTTPDGQVVGPALCVVRGAARWKRLATHHTVGALARRWRLVARRDRASCSSLTSCSTDAATRTSSAPTGGGLRNLTKQPIVPGVWEGFSDPIWSPDGKGLILVGHGIHHDRRLVHRAGLAEGIRPGRDTPRVRVRWICRVRAPGGLGSREGSLAGMTHARDPLGPVR